MLDIMSTAWIAAFCAVGMLLIAVMGVLVKVILGWTKQGAELSQKIADLNLALEKERRYRDKEIQAKFDELAQKCDKMMRDHRDEFHRRTE